MKKKDLTRLFYMVEHNLKNSIRIGFHSHNNMQLAYSNAQSLVHIQTDRELIIDSSIYGMGRGAGNLNTELFLEYLNENADGKYVLKPLLIIIDEILSKFYEKKHWGFTLPNYLSAKHNTHPNYAGYLDDKKTLTVESMDEIFTMMDDSKRVSFNKNYIEDLYIQYMARECVQESRMTELKEKVEGMEVLIIAPGRSSVEEKDIITSCMQRPEIISFSINYNYPESNTDFIFLSNLRRYRELDVEKRSKCVVTSNIPAVDVYLQTKYSDLINDKSTVRDNAGMMLIKFLIQLGAKKILLAGIDGYSVDPTQNFAYQEMNFYTKKVMFEAMNEGMIQALNEFKKQIAIEFLTTPKYIHLL